MMLQVIIWFFQIGWTLWCFAVFIFFSLDLFIIY